MTSLLDDSVMRDARKSQQKQKKLFEIEKHTHTRGLLSTYSQTKVGTEHLSIFYFAMRFSSLLMELKTARMNIDGQTKIPMPFTNESFRIDLV